MPIPYLRRLTGRERTVRSNRQLAGMLAFIAGAVNAGGYLAVRQYTSHMTGVVSAMADALALGDVVILLTGCGVLLFFIGGAATCAILVNWARRQGLHSEYAMPLMLEAALLIVFGLLGGNLERHAWLFVPTTVLLLCYIMGLQNAVVTKLSQAEIRTTHVTGMVTDLGIEIGKLFYWNRNRMGPQPMVRANRDKLRVHTLMIALFFTGGVIGAVGFSHVGFITTVPLAAVLILLAAVPVLDDMRAHLP